MLEAVSGRFATTYMLGKEVNDLLPFWRRREVNGLLLRWRRGVFLLLCWRKGKDGLILCRKRAVNRQWSATMLEERKGWFDTVPEKSSK